jgi:uncharacterized membrane protein YccC
LTALPHAPLRRPASARLSARGLLRLNPGPPRLAFAVRAALAMGICVGAGSLAGDEGAGLIATLGAFTALYGGGTPYRHRAILLALVAAGFVVAAVAGAAAASATTPWPGVAIVTLVAAAASFLCSALNIGPPGAYMFTLVCAASATMHGAPPLWRIALLVTAGAAVSWTLQMLGALRRPYGPEEQAVANAARAIAAFIDGAAAEKPDGLCHAAALRLHDAWTTLVAHQPSRAPPNEKLAHLRALTRNAQRLFGQAIGRANAGQPIDPVQSTQARAIAARVGEPPAAGEAALAHDPPYFIGWREMIAQAAAWNAVPARIALRVGAAALIAGAAIAMLNIGRVSWAVAAAVLVLYQGFDRRRAAERAFERTLGTLVGLVAAAGLLWLAPHGIALVGAVMALQFAVELLVVRNYALAVVLITPLALLVASGARPVPSIGADVLGRGVDTMVGCAIGLVVLLIATGRTDGRIRDAFARALAAAQIVVTMLARDNINSLAARKARRDLRNSAVDLPQLYAAQAEGPQAVRQEADRAWPAITALERLAFRLLAACWEREAAGAERRGAPPIEQAEADEAVRRLQRLQSGLAQTDALNAEDLAAELTALDERLQAVPMVSDEVR